MNHILNGKSVAWKYKWLVVLAWLLNLACSLVVVFPLKSMLEQFSDHSLMSLRLINGLDLEYLFEFLHYNPDATSTLFALFVCVGGIYGILNLFVAAGAYGMIVYNEPWSLSAFVAQAGRVIGRFFRLLLWAIPVYVVFYCLQFIETGVVRVIFGKDPYQYITFWGTMIRVFLGTLGIMIATMVVDYARIHTLRTDERAMRKSLLHGLRFALLHFLPAFGIAFAIAVPSALLPVAVPAIANALTGGTGTIIILFLVQQAAMLLRMYLKVTLYAAQSSFHEHVLPEDRRAEVTPVGAVDPNPLLTV